MNEKPLKEEAEKQRQYQEKQREYELKQAEIGKKLK